MRRSALRSLICGDPKTKPPNINRRTSAAVRDSCRLIRGCTGNRQEDAAAIALGDVVHACFFGFGLGVYPFRQRIVAADTGKSEVYSFPD